MNREEFLARVKELRAHGKTIRAIAQELHAHRSRVHRALRALARESSGGLEATSNEPQYKAGLPGSAFVGRQREMGELMAALEDTLAGRGRLVMLVGEPGIGKTRTAEEFEADAEAHGARVLWGRCYEDRGAPPYWPWVQLIRTYARQKDSDRLRSEMGAGAADISEIAPDLQAIAEPHSPTPLQLSPQLEPEYARFRLFDSITAFLKRASLTQPLVLVLDNLHWADRTSLLLLEFLDQELGDSRLLVVGTYRDVELSRRHPLSETLGELVRGRRFQRIVLNSLSVEDVRVFIQNATGVEPPQELVEVVHSHTEGNPLFVTEVVRMLEQEGALTPERMSREGTYAQASVADWSVRIPEGVREVIGRRLNRLSPLCEEVLTVASVIGREFGFGQLVRAADDISEDQLLNVLDESLRAHVIEELSGQEGLYQFTHVLMQQTILDGLSAMRRAMLHARIAQALEELYASDPGTHASELAYHFFHASSFVGYDKMVRYSLLAGEQALASYAYEEALTHFQAALAAKQSQPMDLETADILFGLGRAQRAIRPKSNYQEVIDTLNRAFDYYVESGEVSRAVAVAEFPFPSMSGLAATRVQTVQRALELVHPDSHQAGRLLAQLGFHLGEQGNYEGAKDAFSKALAIAEHEGDAALKMWTLMRSAWYLRSQWREVVDVCLTVSGLALQLNDPWAEMDARQYGSIGFVALGDLLQAQSNAHASLQVAEKLRDKFHLCACLTQCLSVASLSGDWETQRALSLRGLEAEPSDARFLGSLALLEYEQGNFDMGESYANRLVNIIAGMNSGRRLDYAHAAGIIPLIAYRFGLTRYLERSNIAPDVLLSPASVSPMVTELGVIGLTFIALVNGDKESADQLYEAFKPRRGTHTARAWGFSYDHALGLLSQILGETSSAAAHFEDALAFCRKAGYRPELAWTCHDYAVMLIWTRHTAYTGSHGRATLHASLEKANALLDEALFITSELGMRTLMERVAALKERAEARLLSAPAYPAGLTEREVEVLRLIAAGKSNREIAGQLFISDRTVAQHVTGILSKTGAANRAEATIFAARHGLVS